MSQPEILPPFVQKLAECQAELRRALEDADRFHIRTERYHHALRAIEKAGSLKACIEMAHEALRETA